MTSELEILPDLDRTPTTLFASPDPTAVVVQATRIAEAIGPLIHRQNLVKRIGQSDHVFLEGWTLAGTMLGVFPITVGSGPMFDTDGNVYGYQATVEARTMAGAVVGRADAECTRDESNKWANAPSFQLRSMAITRASSKALRMPLGFVMKLAGYDPTPAEEMEAAAARGETVTGGKGVRPGWRDIGEQQRAHAAVGQLIDQAGLRQWVAEWADSKGYGPRPWAKGQLNQLRRDIDREIEDQKSGGQAAGERKPRQDGPVGDSARAGERPASPPDPTSDPPGSAPPATRGGSDQMSPDSVWGRQSSGTPTSGAVTAVSSASSGPVSASGETDADVSPVPVPDANPTSNDAEEGDALPSDDETGEGPDAGDLGYVPGAARATGKSDDASGPDPSPVARWCEEHGHDIRVVKSWLRRVHGRTFPNVRDRKDLEELRPPESDRVIEKLNEWQKAGQEGE